MALAGFVPDHSDGVAADSHRLPWGPSGRPGANNAETVAESADLGNGQSQSWQAAAAVEPHWLGQAATKITTPSGRVIVIDPFLTRNPKTPPEYQAHLGQTSTHVFPISPGDKVQR